MVDSTKLNTIVGIVGAVIGVIGIVVGIIGIRSLNAAQELRNTVKAGKGNCINQNIHQGASITDVIAAVSKVTDEKLVPYKVSLNNLDDIQKVLSENPRYSIPVVWVGSQEEHNELVRENKTNNSVFYCIKE